MDIDDMTANEMARATELHNRLYSNPKTRARYEALAKEVNPQAVTTEDQLAPVMGPLSERLAKLEAFEQKIDKSSKLWEQNEKLQALRSQFGFTDEGVQAVKKAMDENKLSDPLEAAEIFQNQFKPKPAEVSNHSGWGNGRMGMSKEEADKMVDNPMGWADDEFAKILGEIN